MTLISSISGIRGTIGGKPGDNLTPQDIVNYTSAYATVIKEKKSSIFRVGLLTYVLTIDFCGKDSP